MNYVFKLVIYEYMSIMNKAWHCVKIDRVVQKLFKFREISK